MCLKSSARLVLKPFLVTIYVVAKADTKLNKVMPAIMGIGKTKKTGSRDQIISVVTPRNARGISSRRNDKNKPTRDPITIPRIILTPTSTRTEDMIEEFGVPNALRIENCFWSFRVFTTEMIMSPAVR